MEHGGFSIRFMTIFGVVLLIFGLYLSMNPLKDSYDLIEKYGSQLEEVKIKGEKDDHIIKDINGKKNEAKFNFGILIVILALTGFGVGSFITVEYKIKLSNKYLKENLQDESLIEEIYKEYYEKFGESIKKTKEFEESVSGKQNRNKETISKKIIDQLKELLYSHCIDSIDKTEKRFIINRLPSPEEIISPIRVKEEANIIYLRWISLTSVLLGLIGTMASLIVAISGAVESINLTSGNILEGFRNALEPLKYAFYCSMAGVYAGFTLSLFRIITDSTNDAHYAEIEKRLSILIPKIYKKIGYEPVENKVVESTKKFEEVAGRMLTLSTEIRGITDKISTNTTAIVEGLRDKIVDTFDKNMKQISDNITTQFNEKFKDTTDHFRETIDKALKDWDSKLMIEMNNFTNTLQNVNTSISNEFNHICSILDKIKEDYFKEAIKEPYEKLGSHFDELAGKISNFENGIKQISDNIATQFNETYKDTTDHFRETIGGALEKWDSILMTEINNFRDTMRDVNTKTSDKLQDVNTSISKEFESICNILDNIKEDYFKEAIKEPYEKLGSHFDELADKISNFENGIKQFNNNFSETKNELEGVKDSVFELHKSINESLKQFESETSSFKSILLKYDSVAKEFIDTLNKLKEFTNVSSDTQKHIISLSRNLEGINKDINNAANKFKEISDSLKSLNNVIENLNRINYEDVINNTKTFSENIQKLDASSIKEFYNSIKKEDIENIKALLENIETLLNEFNTVTQLFVSMNSNNNSQN